jgi:hypothetical protein
VPISVISYYDLLQLENVTLFLYAQKVLNVQRRRAYQFDPRRIEAHAAAHHRSRHGTATELRVYSGAEAALMPISPSAETPPIPLPPCADTAKGARAVRNDRQFLRGGEAKPVLPHFPMWQELSTPLVFVTHHLMGTNYIRKKRFNPETRRKTWKKSDSSLHPIV